MRLGPLPIALLGLLALVAGCSRTPSAPAPPPSESTQPAGVDPIAALIPPPSIEAGVPSATRFLEGSGPIATIEQLESGSGPHVAEGTWYSIQYTLTLEDGTPLDDTRSRTGGALEYFYPGGVIDGLEEGVAGMQKGERRRIAIPAEWAFGPSGRGNLIPPNAAVVYDLECTNVVAATGRNFMLSSGLTVTRVVEGTGPAAGLGSFVVLNLAVITGRDEEVVFDTRAPGQTPIETTLPAAPGVLRDGRRTEPRLPNLTGALYGVQAGEYRTVRLPAQHAFGRDGDRRLRVGTGQEIQYDIDVIAVHPPGSFTMTNGIEITDLEIGTGAPAMFGRYLQVRYAIIDHTGRTVASNERPAPSHVHFLPSTRGVSLAAWNNVLGGLRVGGTRRVIVPPDLGYGVNAPPEWGLDPAQPITFEITLDAVRSVAP